MLSAPCSPAPSSGRSSRRDADRPLSGAAGWAATWSLIAVSAAGAFRGRPEGLGAGVVALVAAMAWPGWRVEPSPWPDTPEPWSRLAVTAVRRGDHCPHDGPRRRAGTAPRSGRGDGRGDPRGGGGGDGDAGQNSSRSPRLRSHRSSDGAVALGEGPPGDDRADPRNRNRRHGDDVAPVVRHEQGVVGMGRPEDAPDQPDRGAMVAGPNEQLGDDRLECRAAAAQAEHDEPLVRISGLQRPVLDRSLGVAPRHVRGGAGGVRAPAVHLLDGQQRRHVGIREGIDCRPPRVARFRPPFGRRSRPEQPGERSAASGRHDHRRPTEVLPAHLEVAGAALVVRRVEHEPRSVGSELVDGEEGEPAEQSASLHVRMGGGVERRAPPGRSSRRAAGTATA